jgi:chemotaxis protein MotB
MNLIRVLCSAVLLVFLLGGCVTSGKYDRLESDRQKLADDYQKSQQQLALCEVNSTDLQKRLGVTSSENSKLEGSVADMEKALEEAGVRKKETEKRLKEFRELTEKFKSLEDSGKLRIKVENGRMMVVLSSDVLFPSASAELSPSGKSSIREVTEILKSMNRRFQIEGHTDNLPIRTKQFPSNWELASARAFCVLDTMIAEGLSPEQISAASYASSEPINDNSTREGRAENRRIDIVIVPDLSGLPGYNELNQMSHTAPTH